jgi:hypothetical protein
MGNPFKTSNRRRPDKPHTKDRDSLPRESENMKREIHVLYDDPILISHESEPVQESPEPADDNTGPRIFLIGGSILALLCLWWLAPEWLATTWNNLIQQIFHFAGQ